MIFPIELNRKIQIKKNKCFSICPPPPLYQVYLIAYLPTRTLNIISLLFESSGSYDPIRIVQRTLNIISPTYLQHFSKPCYLRQTIFFKPKQKHTIKSYGFFTGHCLLRSSTSASQLSFFFTWSTLSLVALVFTEMWFICCVKVINILFSIFVSTG